MLCLIARAIVNMTLLAYSSRTLLLRCSGRESEHGFSEIKVTYLLFFDSAPRRLGELGHLLTFDFFFPSLLSSDAVFTARAAALCQAWIPRLSIPANDGAVRAASAWIVTPDRPLIRPWSGVAASSRREWAWAWARDVGRRRLTRVDLVWPFAWACVVGECLVGWVA